MNGLPRPLSAGEERVLRRRARGLPAKTVAHELGVSEQTIKNQMTSIYQKLDVDNLTSALVAVGWVQIPDEQMPVYQQCQFIGQCGRPFEHRGHHGGFRPVEDPSP
jgi:DNA-binding CsgD family transcriptional regulator